MFSLWWVRGEGDVLLLGLGKTVKDDVSDLQVALAREVTRNLHLAAELANVKFERDQLEEALKASRSARRKREKLQKAKYRRALNAKDRQIRNLKKRLDQVRNTTTGAKFVRRDEVRAWGKRYIIDYYSDGTRREHQIFDND